jgi:ZIP family zinc transporter
MAAAFGWGALDASALLLGALIAYRLAPGRGVIAVVMALGTGLLVGSVAFELIDEALKTSTVARVGLLLLIGSAVFTVGDWILSRRGGGERKDPTSAQVVARFAVAVSLSSI